MHYVTRYFHRETVTLLSRQQVERKVQRRWLRRLEGLANKFSYGSANNFRGYRIVWRIDEQDPVMMKGMGVNSIEREIFRGFFTNAKNINQLVIFTCTRPTKTPLSRSRCTFGLYPPLLAGGKFTAMMAIQLETTYPRWGCYARHEIRSVR